MTSKKVKKTNESKTECKECTEKEIKKVVIVGSAGSTIKLTPWDDYSLEIWGLGWRNLPRMDRLFDLHPQHFVDGPVENIQKNYKERLTAFKDIPVYLCTVHPDIPNSVEYPLNEVVKFFGPDLDPSFHGAYFTSSISYMLCLAIYEAYDEIHLYGLDFIADGEYEHQRPNIEYLIGIARGKGIKVIVPQGSALLEFGYLYGYELPPDHGTLNRAVLIDRLKQYQSKRDEALAYSRTADGAIQEVKQLLDMLIKKERGGLIDVPPVKHPADVEANRLRKQEELGND